MAGIFLLTFVQDLICGNVKYINVVLVSFLGPPFPYLAPIFQKLEIPCCQRVLQDSLQIPYNHLIDFTWDVILGPHFFVYGHA